MISGHSSEVAPVIYREWFRSFIESGSGHSSGVVPVIHRKWQDVTEYLRIFFESCYIRHMRCASLLGQSHGSQNNFSIYRMIMENAVLDAIKGRRSIRKYKAEQITDDELQTVL